MEIVIQHCKYVRYQIFVIFLLAVWQDYWQMKARGGRVCSASGLRECKPIMNSAVVRGLVTLSFSMWSWPRVKKIYAGGQLDPWATVSLHYAIWGGTMAQACCPAHPITVILSPIIGCVPSHTALMGWRPGRITKAIAPSVYSPNVTY